MPSADPEKRRAWARAHYERNRQRYIDAAVRRGDVKRWRAKRKAAGLKSRGCVWERLRENAARAAKRGKEYWPAGCRVPAVKAKTVQRVTAESLRKPWHGLKGADKFRVRWQSDPKFRLYHRLKRWMQKHLRDGRKSCKWSAALGYQPDELATHLERQFTKGMGWHNMGEWHIDHIVPVSAFEFSSPSDDDFRACYALANLRPMWARENLSKGHKETHLI